MPVDKLDSLVESMLSGGSTIGEVKMTIIGWSCCTRVIVSPTPKLRN